MHKLLNARRVLRASYPYGYFLTGNKDKKAIFESMQVINCVSKVRDLCGWRAWRFYCLIITCVSRYPTGEGGGGEGGIIIK